MQTHLVPLCWLLCFKVDATGDYTVTKHVTSKFTVAQLPAYLGEAGSQERQPAMHAWRSLCCEGFAVEVLLGPTAVFSV